MSYYRERRSLALMCELLGMSANVPTDICFSFAGLAQRGGLTGPHRDGWGIAIYEGRGCRTFHDVAPSANSEIAKLLRSYPIKSKVVISHIRKANRGRVCLENTHPFSRELWGRRWVFAHNGQIWGIKKHPLEFYASIGTTDSEQAFCWLLDRVRREFRTRPRDRVLWPFLRRLCGSLHAQGVANMLFSDSKYLYAMCSTELCWITRRAPFGPATLIDEDLTVNFAKETTPDDVVTVVATRPLTRDEEWSKMVPGQFCVFGDGEVLSC